MKKSSLMIVTVLGTVGGLLLAIGMCMCLLPEWNALKPGVGLGIAGAAVLLVTWLVGRRAAGKAAIHLNGKYALTILLSLAGAVALGIGLVNCLKAVSTFGLGVGIAGILLLLLSALTGRKAAGKGAIPFNGKLVLAYSIGIIGALILGVGMCMVMVWGATYMIPGILVGAVGLLVCILNMTLRLVKAA